MYLRHATQGPVFSATASRRHPASCSPAPFKLRPLPLQVLEALKACHATGIVHRDVKPQNVIISARDGRAKLIDLGAAADLRVGINYIPNEFLLDPRYAPPQQYIMSTSVSRHRLLWCLPSSSSEVPLPSPSNHIASFPALHDEPPGGVPADGLDRFRSMSSQAGTCC